MAMVNAAIGAFSDLNMPVSSCNLDSKVYGCLVLWLQDEDMVIVDLPLGTGREFWDLMCSFGTLCFLSWKPMLGQMSFWPAKA